jgi:hypothetical protein
MKRNFVFKKHLGQFFFFFWALFFVACSDDEEAPKHDNAYIIDQHKEDLTGGFLRLAAAPSPDNESLYMHELALYNEGISATLTPDKVIQTVGLGDIFYINLVSPNTSLVSGVYKWTKGGVSKNYTFQDSNAWYHSEDGNTELGEFVGGEIKISKSGEIYTIEGTTLVYVDLNHDGLSETSEMKIYFEGSILKGYEP